MTSALAAADLPPIEQASLEERLFDWSPVGVAPTAGLVFAAAAGSFFAVSWLVHYAMIGANGPLLVRAIPGLAISLLLATALGMGRYAELKQREEAAAFASIISSKTVSAATLLRRTSPGHRLGANLAGVAFGVAVTCLGIPQALLKAYPVVYVWQGLLTIVLCVMFARGVVMMSRNGRRLKDIIDHGLQIDLLHTDRLSVIGRQSARNALVWFTYGAVLCLFFVGGDQGVTTIPIVVACAGVGSWIFYHPMMRVHQRIRAEKAVALDRVRDRIAATFDEEARDAASAARLPGLIAYEARIQAARDWPFDQSTLIHVAAYVLIPTIPWVGEALVSAAVQRLAH